METQYLFSFIPTYGSMSHTYTATRRFAECHFTISQFAGCHFVECQFAYLMSCRRMSIRRMAAPIPLFSSYPIRQNDIWRIVRTLCLLRYPAFHRRSFHRLMSFRRMSIRWKAAPITFVSGYPIQWNDIWRIDILRKDNWQSAASTRRTRNRRSR